MKGLLIALILVLFEFSSFSQTTKPIKKPIQLSGVVVAGDSLNAIPSVSIKIIKTDSIDYSYFFSVLTDDKGFFLLMAKPGDVLEFKKEGYKDSRYAVSDTLTRKPPSIVYLMERNTQPPEVLPKK